MIEYISYNKIIHAIIIRNEYNKDGVHFFTENDMSQQLGYMKYKKGKIIQPHIHKSTERKIYFTQEVLLIKKGLFLQKELPEKNILKELSLLM